MNTKGDQKVSNLIFLTKPAWNWEFASGRQVWICVSGVFVAIMLCRKMTEWVEQCYCIKFCQKLGDTQTETIHKIQLAFGDEAIGVTQIKEWFNHFKNGRTSVESDQRSGRPSTRQNPQVIEEVSNLIMSDRRLIMREIEEEVGISYGSVQAILTEDLGMWRVAAKFVPKLLSPDQRSVPSWSCTGHAAVCQWRSSLSEDWSLVMRVGCMGTTQKPRFSHRNGSTQCLHDCRKSWRPCWQFSSITKELQGSNLNIFSQVQTLHSRTQLGVQITFLGCK